MSKARRWPATVCIVVATLVLSVTSTLGPAIQRAGAQDRFWTKDTTHYQSPWFEGRHRIMIPFGCTRAPYYAPDPRCSRHRGFHHGLDVAMGCGTKLFSNVRGRVLSTTAPGAPGPAYGALAFRIRARSVDFVFGHVRRVLVESGDRVARGQLIARAGALGAPDGCHLHFEVRPHGGGYTSARQPRPYLHLKAPAA